MTQTVNTASPDLTVHIARHTDKSATVRFEQTDLDLKREDPLFAQTNKKWLVINHACELALSAAVGDDYELSSSIRDEQGGRMHELQLWCLVKLESCIAKMLVRKACPAATIYIFVDGVRLDGSLEHYARNNFSVDQWFDLGEMNVIEDLVVGDPCYGAYRSAEVIKSPLPGLWHGACRFKTFTGFFGYDLRCWELVVRHDSFAAEDFGREHLFQIEGNAGVDSGQVGISPYSLYPSLKEDELYEVICELTQSSVAPTMLKDVGWFAASGYGDGGYDVKVARQRDGQAVAITVSFISDTDLAPSDDDNED